MRYECTLWFRTRSLRLVVIAPKSRNLVECTDARRLEKQENFRGPGKQEDFWSVYQQPWFLMGMIVVNLKHAM